MHLKHKILAAILLILLCIAPTQYASAAKVGYTNKKCYVYAKPSTSAKKKSIAINTKLYYVGTKGKFYCVRVGSNKTKVYILKKYVSKKKTKTDTSKAPAESSSSWKSKVVKMNWSSGKSVLKVGKTATLYSTEKGIELTVKRLGGTLHMDLEPLTASDTEKLRKIAGGSFSWTTHPVILKISGKYIACSINTMPHGRQSIEDNEFDGQFCLHMVGSKTHGTNKVNNEHQKSIAAAYNWAHKK